MTRTIVPAVCSYKYCSHTLRTTKRQAAIFTFWSGWLGNARISSSSWHSHAKAASNVLLPNCKTARSLHDRVQHAGGGLAAQNHSCTVWPSLTLPAVELG
eukprot:3586844-Amphidinium_carterae.1